MTDSKKDSLRLTGSAAPGTAAEGLCSGGRTSDTVVYVHGKGGSPVESERYRPLFPGCRVLGLDYRASTPREAGRELRDELVRLNPGAEPVILIANSIGACFSLYAGIEDLVRRAYFISPVLDLEGLIRGMMAAENVTEEELRARGRIPTAFGEELSWEVLCFLREHPPSWRVPTQILWGSRDTLTPYEAARTFALEHGAGLTVMEGGEHWFHTAAQLSFLDAWIRSCEEG